MQILIEFDIDLDLERGHVSDGESTEAADGHEEPKVGVEEFGIVDDLLKLVVEQDNGQKEEGRVEVVIVGKQPDFLPHHGQHLLGVDRVHRQEQ